MAKLKDKENKDKAPEINGLVLCKVLNSHPQFGYFAGDVAEISRDDIEKFRLVENGFVEIEK